MRIKYKHTIEKIVKTHDITCEMLLDLSDIKCRIHTIILLRFIKLFSIVGIND